MKVTLEQIKSDLEDLLSSAGIPNDHYLVRMNYSNVSVEFDSKEAVDYFKGDYEDSPMAGYTYWEYRKVGKRHCAYIHIK